MDGNLPFLGPSVEFSTVPSIEPEKILNYFNKFVSESVQILNQFSTVCEAKLDTLSFRLGDIEATLSILEAKLSSIPNLEAPSLPSSEEPAPQSTPADPEMISDSPAVHQVEEESPPNPEIMRFVKMLHVGVPRMAVELKMRAEGFDPALLNHV